MLSNFILKFKPTKQQLTWIRTKSKKQKCEKKYSETLNLPKTNFPITLRSGEANKREREIQQVRFHTLAILNSV